MAELEFTPINTGEKAGKGTKQSGNEKDIIFCKYSQLTVWFDFFYTRRLWNRLWAVSGCDV